MRWMSHDQAESGTRWLVSRMPCSGRVLFASNLIKQDAIELPVAAGSNWPSADIHKHRDRSEFRAQPKSVKTYRAAPPA